MKEAGQMFESKHTFAYSVYDKFTFKCVILVLNLAYHCLEMEIIGLLYLFKWEIGWESEFIIK